jgi:hypothetical protein
VGGLPVSLLKNAGWFTAGGLAAIAIMVEAEAGPPEGPIMQVIAIGGGIAAVVL